MKNKQQIELEIKDVEREILRARDKELTKTKENRATKRLLFLRKMIEYIDAGVTQEKLEKDLMEVKRKIEVIDTGYRTWMEHLTLVPENSLGIYHKEMGRPNLCKQKDSLEYLLS